jgi:hypothetical protein
MAPMILILVTQGVNRYPRRQMRGDDAKDTHLHRLVPA